MTRKELLEIIAHQAKEIQDMENKLDARGVRDIFDKANKDVGWHKYEELKKACQLYFTESDSKSRGSYSKVMELIKND